MNDDFLTPYEDRCEAEYENSFRDEEDEDFRDEEAEAERDHDFLLEQQEMEDFEQADEYFNHYDYGE